MHADERGRFTEQQRYRAQIRNGVPPLAPDRVIEFLEKFHIIDVDAGKSSVKIV